MILHTSRSIEGAYHIFVPKYRCLSLTVEFLVGAGSRIGSFLSFPHDFRSSHDRLGPILRCQSGGAAKETARQVNHDADLQSKSGETEGVVALHRREEINHPDVSEHIVLT